ncbi:tenascin-like [Diorhabda sublineata]|uniref:tenascin-like n=1 Tax=Diorhabda sublineata TaxID=1163346 RepID=UPI0024E07EBF|nr:tenascin-like [Diorhabda sublineata]
MLLICFVLSLTTYFTGILCESCENNWNCSGNAICKNGECNCDTISYWSMEREKCMPYVTEYKGYCVENDQCEWLGDNAECSKNICDCKENFTWFEGKCKKYANIGDYCDESIMCYDQINHRVMHCDDKNKCTCSDGYYNRGSDCRKKVDDGSCAINYDCNQSPYSSQICVLSKCVEKTDPQKSLHSSKELVNTQHEKKYVAGSSGDINCTSDIDCRNMANSVCDANTNTCRCKNSYFLEEGNCLPGFAVCKANDTCSSALPNSYCFHGVCVCLQGYFYSENMCIPEIGIPINTTNDEDCKIKASILQDGACYCIKFWFADEYNRKCIKSTVQDNQRCVNDYWCNAMGPYSFCNSSGLCQCSSFAQLDEETFYCEKVGNIPNDTCVRDTSCGYNRRCQNEQCVCKEKFSEVEGHCLPDLGGPCDVNDCSHIENASCFDSICSCNMNYTSYNNQCLSSAESFDDACEVSEQCQKLKFTECSSNSKKCECIKGFEFVDGKCWESKDYGSPCMTRLDCTEVLDEEFECINNKCVCPIGQVWDEGFCFNSMSITLVTYPYLLMVLLLIAFFF